MTGVESGGTVTLSDYWGRAIRLANERQGHILEHPESVHVYHRFYETTPVTSKFLQVAVKLRVDDAFVLTAFYGNRSKKGVPLWRA